MNRRILILWTVLLFSCAFKAQLAFKTEDLLSAKQVDDTKYYRRFADSLNTLNQNEDAISVLKKALKSPSLKTNKHELSTIYTDLGDYYSDLQEYHLSIFCFNKSLVFNKDLKDELLFIRNYTGLAGAYSNFGKTDTVLGCLKNALQLAEKNQVKYYKFLKVIYNSLGVSHSAKFNFPVALKYFYKAINICEKKNDIDGLSSTYNNMGNLYSELGDFNKALEYYRKEMQILPSSYALVNLGILYEDIGNNDSAFYYIKKAIQSDQLSGDKAGLSTSYTVIGNLFKKSHQLDSAFFYYDLSTQYALQIEDEQVIQNNNYNIVDIFMSQKKYREAKILAEKNLKSIMQGDDLGFISDTYSQLKDICNYLGEFKQAFEYQTQYIVYKDSVLEADKTLEVKKIELNAEYKTKSSNDSLLHAQATLYNDLKHETEIKKQRMILFGFILILGLVAAFSVFVYNRYKVSIKQKEIINLQKNEMYSQKLLVEEKQKEIIDSINYAKRIQYTLLAHKDFLTTYIPNHFVYFNPKDIVSGDFYWATKKDQKFYMAVCDSTGHGVPGAFMSLLNIGFLSEAINEKGIEKPNEVFNYVRQKLINSLSKDGQKDGFDGVLLCMDLQTKQITYSAANNKPILISDNQFVELGADRMPVGKGERKDEFKLYTIDGKQGDMLYLYTDGYADQFGGPKGKKYKYKPLNDLILLHHENPIHEQQLLLQRNFESWRGDLEQVDDVCVIGIKI
jgi:serine phosphatase RsbU (regulator of sigma subunit)/tetratricopeptide (TPR) repeat protein